MIAAGVTLRGIGNSNNLRSPDYTKGSVIGYCGSDYAMELYNANGAHVENLVVSTTYGCANPAASKGGIILKAVGSSGVESVTLRDVLIYRFLGGTGLTLYADQGGGLAYCSFYDVRVRHAVTGILLEATGVGGSFVNSNSFYHGAVSGGGFDYGVRMVGPGANNNNVFLGTVVEPYISTFGHFHVMGSKSQLQCIGCRAEGANLADSAPLLFFGEDTYGSFWTGGLSDGGLVLANALNHDLSGAAAVGAEPSGVNLFPNSGFVGAGTKPGAALNDHTPPHWKTTGAVSVAASASVAAWLAGSRADFTGAPPLASQATALTITVSPNTVAILKPDAADGAWPPARASFLQCTVGAWMRSCLKTGAKIRAVATSVGLSGMESGTPLLNDGEWHFVGLSAG